MEAVYISLFAAVAILGCILSKASRRPKPATAGRKPATGSQRRLERFPVNASARLFLENRGEAEAATTVDMSEYGCSLRIRRSLPVDTYVYVEVPELQYALTGHVRRCAREGRGYLLGVEFNGPAMRAI